MIIPFSDFATRSLRRRTGVYRSAQGCWKGCLRHESTQLVFLFYFYREMSPAINPQVAIAAWHCLVLDNTGTLHNCSLAWLNIKSHLNGWMISTIRQHFEGILVLFHSGSGQEEVTREMMHWHCTYYQCGVGLPACVFTVDGNQKGIIVMKFHVLQRTVYVCVLRKPCQLPRENTQSVGQRSAVCSPCCCAGRAGPRS